MNLDELTLGQIKQLAILAAQLGVVQQAAQPCSTLGKYCVIRTYSAGVHVGVVKSRTGREVELTDACRIWSWAGAKTLSEISLRGVGSGSKVSEVVASIVLTEVIEVIQCTSDAESNLRGQKWA